MISNSNIKFLENFNLSLKKFYPNGKISFYNLNEKIKKEEIKAYGKTINRINYGLIDEINNVIKEISRICSTPLISVKYLDEIVKIESATNINEESIKETINDSSLWKIRNQKPEPEKSHNNLIEENYATYENCFIKLLIDKIEGILRYYEGSIFSKIKTIGSYFNSLELGFSKFSVFNNYSIKDLTKKAILDKGNSKYFEYYKKTLQILNKIKIFKSSLLYKECSRVKDIDPNIHLTNILSKNYSYNYCFKFYINKILRNYEKTTEINYYNYALIRLLISLFDNGFSFKEPNSVLTLYSDNDNILRFDNIKLIKNGVNLTIRSLNELDIEFETNLDFSYYSFIKNKNLKNKRANKLHLIFRPSLSNIFDYEELNNLNTYYILFNTDGLFNKNIVLVNDKKDLDITLNNFVNTLAFMIEGSNEIYSKKCPICGSDLINEVDGDYTCENCDSNYSLLKNKRKEFVYIKRFNR